MENTFSAEGMGLSHRCRHPEPPPPPPPVEEEVSKLHVCFFSERTQLTHPQVVHLLAHAAVLFGDLLKVLVEAWLQRQEARQWGEVRLWDKSFMSG